MSAAAAKFAKLAGAIAAAALLLPAAFESRAQERTDPLPPEEVFRFAAEARGQVAEAVIVMLPDYYLYRNRLAVSVSPGFAVEEVRVSEGEPYDDPFFGPTEILHFAATAWVRVSGEGDYELRVISQGCDEQLGICYPPISHVAQLDTSGEGTFEGFASAQPVETLSATGFAPATGAPDSAEAAPAPVESQDEAADAAGVLAEKNLWQIMLVFFGFGLLLSFTPCVLPMLPILLGVISGSGGGRRSAALTFSYVCGVCITYTALGVAAGLSGSLITPYLQQPPALIATALIFVALAASMFGAYDIQPPAFMRNAGGGRGRGAFVMGALSAAVVSPCVAAPLVGALIYIGSTGDAWTGAAALFSLSLGMSVLLLAAGLGGGALLPKAGAWSEDVKKFFGALMLAAAIWVTSPLLPGSASMALYGIVALFCGILMWTPGVRGLRALAAAILLWGAAMILGAAGGGRDPLAPLAGFAGGGTSAEAAPVFEPVQSLPELDARLAASQQPVMLEFYADWCVSCKEMERFVFTDPQVRAKLDGMLLLRADITADSAAHRAMLERFGLYGPPAMLFFAPGGAPIPVRVSGYQSAGKFLETLKAAGA